MLFVTLQSSMSIVTTSVKLIIDLSSLVLEHVPSLGRTWAVTDPLYTFFLAITFLGFLF